MDIDPMESVEGPGENEASKSGTLTTWVAITVALVATFTGICKVKDDNIVQAMQQAQANKLDLWSFYQARNLREEVARAELTQLQLALPGTLPARRAALDSAIQRYRALAASQAAKKDSLRVQAEAAQQTYDALNYRDDQFDLSDALIALAISLLAMTALTRKRWLFWVAMVPTALGVLMGVAGLLGWKLHPDALTRLLS